MRFIHAYIVVSMPLPCGFERVERTTTGSIFSDVSFVNR